MTEQLKPCPHCGKTETLELVHAADLQYDEDEHDVYTHSASFGVVCSAAKPSGPGGCGAMGGFASSKPSAIEAWNRRAQPAQAVPLLSDAEIDDAYEKARADYQRSRFAVRGQQLTAQDSPDWWLARRVEQAVRAKMGVGVGWQPISTAPKDGTEILLSNGEVVAQGNWLHAEPYIKERRDIDGRYVDQDEFDGYDGWIDHTGGMQPDPTRWMPLPPPPGIVDKEGA